MTDDPLDILAARAREDDQVNLLGEIRKLIEVGVISTALCACDAATISREHKKLGHVHPPCASWPGCGHADERELR